MHKQAARERVTTEQAAVRAILLKWDPFGGSPDDDCLVDHVISALHQGRTKHKDIAEIIASALTEHVGIEEEENAEEKEATIPNVAGNIVLLCGASSMKELRSNNAFHSDGPSAAREARR